MSHRISFVLLAVGLSVASAAGCGGRQRGQGQVAVVDKGRAVSAPNAGFDDNGRCDFKGRDDREVSETTGPGALLPNVRRVYQIVGTGEDRRRVLACREVDTNLDGVKDLVRTFNDKGEALREEADANYDGRIDTWLTFVAGRMSETALDTNNDGLPDVWKFYTMVEDASGEPNPNLPVKLSRIRRDTNFDGKPDVWEFYVGGRLERMGVDLDFDGHVDRWDHDEVAKRAVDAAEKAAERSEGAKAPPPPADETDDNADGQ